MHTNALRQRHWTRVALVSIGSCLLLLSGACFEPAPERAVAVAELTPGEYPILKAFFPSGGHTYVRQTQASFTDTLAQTRHELRRFDRTANAELAVAPVGPVSVTSYQGSDWMAWKEVSGSTHYIYARMVGWGPGQKRLVRVATNITQAPAISSFNGELVVVWGENNLAYMSHAKYGLYWSAPLAYNTTAYAFGPSFSLCEHNGTLYLGYVTGQQVFVARILSSFTFGTTHSVTTAPSAPIGGAVGMSSNGTYLAVAYAYGLNLVVRHSLSGYDLWGAEKTILAGSSLNARPALSYDTRTTSAKLRVVFPTGTSYLYKASSDANGMLWSTPNFQVDDLGVTASNPAALVTADYSFVAPTPVVTVLQNSGRAASQAFNVVIMPEGYLSSEMSTFQTLAGKIADIYKNLNPFSKLAGQINIYRIDIPSRQKGVNASPAMAKVIRSWDGGTDGGPFPEARQTDTAFRAVYAAHWQNHTAGPAWAWSPLSSPIVSVDPAEDDYNGPNQHVTANKPLELYADGYYMLYLANRLIPGLNNSKDMFYLVVDRDAHEGGYTKDSRQPTITDAEFAPMFTWVHEHGHNSSMAGLLDEEFENNGWGEGFPNHTADANWTSPTHKWAHFFVSGQSIKADPKTRPPIPADFFDTTLVNGSKIFNAGLWATSGVTNWGGGAITYGPSFQCLMNHTGGNTHFCPVCTEAEVKALKGRAGMTFSDASYHGATGAFIEYQHWASYWGWPEPPLAGSLSVNGTAVPSSKFRCFWVLDEKICSVDVTAYLGAAGTNHVLFKTSGFGSGASVDLKTIQVVNGAGAPLPLFPVTDLSHVGSSAYQFMTLWNFYLGDLELRF